MSIRESGPVLPLLLDLTMNSDIGNANFEDKGSFSKKKQMIRTLKFEASWRILLEELRSQAVSMINVQSSMAALHKMAVELWHANGDQPISADESAYFLFMLFAKHDLPIRTLLMKTEFGSKCPAWIYNTLDKLVKDVLSQVPEVLLETLTEKCNTRCPLALLNEYKSPSLGMKCHLNTDLLADLTNI